MSLLVATGRQTVLLVARKGFPHLEFRVRQIFVKLIGEFQHFSKKRNDVHALELTAKKS